MIKGLMDSGRRIALRLHGWQSTESAHEPASTLRVSLPGPSADREDLLHFERPAGDARLRRRSDADRESSGHRTPGCADGSSAANSARSSTITTSATRPSRRTALDNGLAPFDDVTLVHCVRWQDHAIAQIGHGDVGYPNAATLRGLEDLGRQRGPRLDRRAHRAADATRDAALARWRSITASCRA